MRHHTVLRRGIDGPWHYVSASERGAYPIEGCTAACDHQTAAEAYEHHRAWLLDTAQYDVASKDEQRRCEECGAWTQRRVQWGGGSGAVLCDDHATRGVLERRHLPPGTQLDAYTIGGG